jgi:uncharacterized protein (DUF169 family)
MRLTAEPWAEKRRDIMDMEIKKKFEGLWEKYFNGAELPLCFFYSNEKPKGAEMPKPAVDHRCLIGDLAKARRGKNVALNADVIGCGGGKRYLGFSSELRPDFEYFLSYGIPGKVQGERYKKTPELVAETMKRQPPFTAPAPYIVFKRWDRMEESDNPDVVIFFARPDVLSGVFTLASFDEADTNSVFSPFGAGCSTIVQYPYFEKDKESPRAVLGMLDVSARPCVPADIITLALPMKRFVRMIDNMKESFLITDSWKKVRRRISASDSR